MQWDLENLITRTDVVPAVKHVELYPCFVQREVCAADARHRVVMPPWLLLVS
jgi:diketogulonate reductase-like aldo/keto reductase